MNGKYRLMHLKTLFARSDVSFDRSLGHHPISDHGRLIPCYHESIQGRNATYAHSKGQGAIVVEIKFSLVSKLKKISGLAPRLGIKQEIAGYATLWLVILMDEEMRTIQYQTSTINTRQATQVESKDTHLCQSNTECEISIFSYAMPLREVAEAFNL